MFLQQLDLTIANRVHRWHLIAAVLIGLGLFVAFTLAPLRVQGRIVEIVTLGDWPMEWAARKQFREKQIELRTIIEILDKNPEVVGLRVVPTGTGLHASFEETPTSRQDYDNPNILEALQAVEARWVRVYDDQVHIVLGEEARSNVSFVASFTLARIENYEIDPCESLDSRHRGKLGACGFPLADKWLLVYEWYPTNPDELQRAVDELTD
jgi:hypothetical protein